MSAFQVSGLRVSGFQGFGPSLGFRVTGPFSLGTPKIRALILQGGTAHRGTSFRELPRITTLALGTQPIQGLGFRV